MKTIYTAVMARLKEQVPVLKWIDLDCGQINSQKERPPVAFPCAVVGMSLNNCEDRYGKVQVCRARISVRIAQNPPVSRTNSEAAGDIRQSSLARYELIDQVFKALQGFETDDFNPLSRTGQTEEKRTDGLFVYRIEFNTEFEDETAEDC
ncbi:hypothetical protein FACS1894177_06490 [Bacteroidia bacterium]|nr:hypothetical protein FACS1894177_06490 [Bacteroidia bacterium]